MKIISTLFTVGMAVIGYVYGGSTKEKFPEFPKDGSFDDQKTFIQNINGSRCNDRVASLEKRIMKQPDCFNLGNIPPDINVYIQKHRFFTEANTYTSREKSSKDNDDTINVVIPGSDDNSMLHGFKFVNGELVPTGSKKGDMKTLSKGLINSNDDGKCVIQITEEGSPGKCFGHN